MLGIAIVMGYLYQGPPFRCAMHHHLPTLVSGHILHELSTFVKLLHLLAHHSASAVEDCLLSSGKTKTKHGLAVLNSDIDINCLGGAIRGWESLSASWHLALLQHALST